MTDPTAHATCFASRKEAKQAAAQVQSGTASIIKHGHGFLVAVHSTDGEFIKFVVN